LDKESGLYIFDEDALLLIGKTIPQFFLTFFDNVCEFCQERITDEQNQSYTLPCACRICKKCCEKAINNLTDGKVVLNNFEKGNLKKINLL
jgi:hypothetical protein